MGLEGGWDGRRVWSKVVPMSGTEELPGWAREAVGWIVRRELGASLRSVAAVPGGYSGGMVCLARTGDAAGDAVVVKLIKGDGEPASPETDLEARVYGKAGSDLGTIHGLLRDRGLPTYELLGQGKPGEGVPCR